MLSGWVHTRRWPTASGASSPGGSGGGRWEPAAWLDGAVAALAGSAVFAATLLAGPLAAAAQGEPMTFATNLAYPIGDLILLGFALAALSATGWRPGRTIGLIAAGLLLRTVTNFIYLDQITQGTYVDGGILDICWPAAALLVAAAACVPDEPVAA